MSKKLRILFISKEYPPETGGGGIGSYLYYISPTLVKRGNEVHILSYLPGQTLNDYLDRGVHIHRRGNIYIKGLSWVQKFFKLPETFSRILNGISIYIEYLRLKKDFDIIEYPDWGAEGWLFSLLHDKPLVAHLHTPLIIINRYIKKSSNFDIKSASFLERFSVNKANYITSSSYLLIDELKKIKWLTNKNLIVIPHTIDLSFWEDVEPINNTPKNILYIGRIESLKAPEILLEAIYLLKNKFPDAKGIFIGKSNGQREGKQYIEWIRENYSNLDNIAIFLGGRNLNNLKYFLSNSLVTVIPSWFESYSIAALEAMAGGRPVIVTRNCGVSELIEKTGCGIVVPPGDPISIANAINPFLENKEYAKYFGLKAKEIIKKELNPEKISEEREKIYKMAISLYHNKN